MMAPRPETLTRRIDEEEALIQRNGAALETALEKEQQAVIPSTASSKPVQKQLFVVLTIALIAFLRLLPGIHVSKNARGALSWAKQVNGVVKKGDDLQLWKSIQKSSASSNYSWFEELSRRTKAGKTSATMTGTDMTSAVTPSSLLRGGTNPPASTQDHGVVLMFTSDIHGHVRRTCRGLSCYPGAASIASVVRTVRQSTAYPSLLIDAGDALFGAPEVNETIVGDVMNLLGYDATALGNHDFDIGSERLESFADHINFPILASNVDGASKFLHSHLRVKLSEGVVLCLVGISTSEANPLADAANVTIRSEEDSVIAYITKLKKDGTCQHAIVVSHGGIVIDQQIAKHSTIVDAIIGGHSHIMTGVPAGAMPESAEFGEVRDLPFPFRPDVADAPIAHVGSYGRYMGLLQLEWSGSNLTKIEGNLVPLDSRHGVEPDVVVDKWLNERTSAAKGGAGISMTIEMAKGLGKNDACGFICRKKECLLGNLVADAMRSCVLNDGPCSHAVPKSSESLPVVALMESGTLRDCVSTDGDEDFSSILPWPNNLFLLTVTGSTLLGMLEHGVKSREHNGGAFLQTSGLSYKYKKALVANVSVPIGAQQVPSHNVSGDQNRVIMTKNLRRCTAPTFASSEPLHNDTKYLIVVTDWLASGGDGYEALVATSLSSTNTNVTLRDMVLKHSTASPRIQREGRSCLIQATTPSSAANAMSGFVGGYIAFFASFPLYTLFVRKSTNGKEKASRRGLFEGVWLGSLATAVCQFIYFLIYHSESLLQYSPLIRSSMGSISTVLATNPLWVIVTRMQTADDHLSMFSAMSIVLEEQGWRGFFAGVLMNLAMCVFPIVRQVTMEAILEAAGAATDSPTRVAFAAGFGACVATIVTLPIQRWRVRLQQGMKGKAITAGKDCCDGLWFKVLHSCVSSFVLFVVKAHLDDVVMLVMLSD